MSCRRLPRFLHAGLTFSLLLLCLTGAAFAQEEAPAEEPAEQTETTAPPESPEAPPTDAAAAGLAGFPDHLAAETDFDAAREAVQARAAELRTEAAELEAGGVSDNTLAPYRERIEKLETLELLVQRRRTLLDRFRETEESMEEQRARQAAFEERGLDGEPPYTLGLLDQLRDERSHVQRDREATALSLDALHEQVRRAEDDLAAVQRARRQARDTLERAQDGPARQAAAVTLEITRLDEILAVQRIESLRAQLELTRKQREMQDARRALLDSRLAAVEQDVVFSEEALQERLAEIEARRKQLETELREARRTRDANESKLYDARRALQRPEDETRRAALADQVAAREAWLEASSRGVEYLEHRIANISTQQKLWEWRHALMNGAGGTGRSAWLAEARGVLTELGKERAVVEARLNAMRATQLDLANRLETQSEVIGDPEAVRSRLKAFEQLETRSREYLASLANVQALAGRLETQLTSGGTPASLGDWLGVGWEYAARVWAYELFVVQDRGVYAGDIILAVIVFIIALLLVMTARGLMRRTVLPRLIGNLERGQTLLRDVVLVLIRNTTRSFTVLLAFYAAMAFSGLAQGHWQDWLRALVVVALWLQTGWWAGAVLLRVLERTRIRKERADPSSVSGYGLLSFFGRLAIWAVVALSVLSYFEYPIAGLIGALGVGGIAVAFALQNILADIFNSMAIILDKPFRVGDFIITGETLGVVEQIGIKTTRIRSLSGEQIIMTNTDVLASRIRNYKRMYERRVVFGFGVIYQTPPEKLEIIPPMIKEIIESQSKTRFDRAHFAKYGDFSLDFEVVYYVLGPDYALYMDIQQAINLEMYRRFRQEGIEFAYPTQEVIVTRKAAAPAEPGGGPEA